MGGAGEQRRQPVAQFDPGVERLENGGIGAPAVLIASDPWCEAMQAKYEGQIAFARREGSARIRERDAKAGVVTFQLRWV